MKNFRGNCILALLLCAVMSITACGGNNGAGGNDNSNDGKVNGSSDADSEYSESFLIVLDDDKTDVGESKATYGNGVLRITKSGSYRLKGKLTNGQVYIKVPKTEAVELILDGCTIQSQTSSAIYCESTDKLYITVSKGTDNVLSDARNYVYKNAGDDEPNACIFSSDDITLRGEGKLTVSGNFKNGISSKNDIKIKEVTLQVNAVNTAIRGKDSVEINSGVVTLVAENDGIKTTQAEKMDKGYVEINGGTVNITAGDDAIQATIRITITDGKVVATFGGKSLNCDGEIYTEDGTFTEK